VGEQRGYSASVPKVWVCCRVRRIPKPVHVKEQDYTPKQGSRGVMCT